MKQSQTHKPAKKDGVKAPSPRLTFVTKTANPYQAQQKSANIEDNTKKKPKKNRQIHSQMCTNDRNKTQQTIKKKAKIAAQQRKKRIKTTTCNTPSTARLVESAAQNRKRNPPDQQTGVTAVRSAPYTTKQAKTIANNRKHKKTPPDKGDTRQLCLPRRGIRAGGRIHSQTTEITFQTNTPAGSPNR